MDNSRGIKNSLITKCLFFITILMLSSTSFSKSLEERVDILERKVSSKLLLELSSEIQQLQEEVRKLRGQLEVANKELQQYKTQQQSQYDNVVSKQKELYSDIDRRLYTLEIGQERSGNEPIRRDDENSNFNVDRVEDRKIVHSPNTQGGTDLASEVSAYKSAFELLRDGNYQLAATKFEEFLTLYPEGKYADNAQYWLGEANYVTRNFSVAKNEFSKVISDYPRSTKVSDALLKIGYIHYEEGDWENSKDYLTQVINKYPRSTAANLAKKRLQRIKREGN